MSSEAGQYLSGDEDILAGSPKMEDSIYSSSPAIKLETNRIDKDNTSTISSVKLGDCAGSDNNTSKKDCVSNNQVVDTTNINNSPRDDEIFNGPMLDNVDEITSEDKAPHTEVLDQTSDVEYSSNYEEDEESDIDNTKSLQNRTTTDNNGIHGNNKPPGGDEAAISNDIGTSSVRIQNVDSCSEKNENSYNSNNYESDEYEDLTDSDNTDYETDSDTPTKSPFLERKEIVREQNMELQSSLPSKDFLDHSQLQSNHTDSIKKQSHLNITVNDIHSIHSVSRSDHSDPNDTSKDDDQSVQHHGGYNTDRDSHGEESSEYDDDFDSESDHSSNENEPKNKSNSKTLDEPVVNDFEKKFNHQSNSFDVTDREVDKSDKNFRPSKAYATHVDQPAGLVKQTPDTATSSNKENDRSRRFHNSTISNRIEKETVHTHKARILPEDTSSGGGKHNHVSKTTKPKSPRSASVTKVSNVQNRNVKKKILRRRSGSLPNKIKENIPVPSRQNLYKAPKDIIVQYSNDSKQEQAKSIRRAPLPLITKQSEKKNMEKEYMNLKHSRVESLVQENKVPFEEDRIPHLDKTLKPNMSELQQRTLSAKPNTHIPNVSSTVHKTNIQHISGSKPNQIKPLPMTRKSRNKTEVTDQLININNQCYKGKDLVKQDDGIRTLEMSLSSTADMPGSNNPDKDDTCGTGREAQYSSELAIDVPNTSYECNPHKINIGSNKTNDFELASQDIVSKTPAQEFVDLKSEERTHNQYSISTASNLTMSGNDSFKSVTDKTNRTENFITGNELITPLASHEKQEENNNYAIKLKGEAIKNSAVGCASSESQESTDSMEDTSDSNVVKHKGYRQRPLNRNLYRSHTRPRHITTKADNKLSKYGLERPSSPFIFSGTKSYIRQSSLTSELHTFSEDGSSDDFHERRKAKTGLADIARLRDIRRQLRLPEEINVNPQPELTNVNIDGEDTGKRRIIAETKKTKNGGCHSSAGKFASNLCW